MKQLLVLLFITFFILSISALDLDNTKGEQIRIVTIDKSVFLGMFFDYDEDFITIITFSGEVKTIYRESISSITILGPDIDKKSLYMDSASNRLIIMPTGFAMEPGEFHVADQEIAVVTMSYGVNSNFTLWGGISIPGAVGSVRYIHELGDKAAISAGSFLGLSWIEFVGIVLPYSIFSYGNPDNNFTLGGGPVYFFNDTEFNLEASVLAIGGKKVLSDSTALVTETWLIWGKMKNDVERDYNLEDWDNYPEPLTVWDPVPMAFAPAVVFRIAGEKFSWDIGAVVLGFIEKIEGRYKVMGITGEENIFIPLPLLSVTYRID